MRQLIVYFKSETYFKHSRQVYIAARTKKEASEISGQPVGHFDKNYCRQFPVEAKEVPPFIRAEGAWLEIRDLDREGGYEPERSYNSGSHKKGDRIPTNEAAFIRCATLEACKEAFTLKLDRALQAAGVPKEAL